MKNLKTFILTSLLALAPSVGIAEESAYPTYTPRNLPDGVITSVGSDSMGELMNVWVEHYKKLQPKVTVQLTSGGSAAAPAALIEGSANIGPMARPMKPQEVADFRARYGFEPTQIKTAISAIAVYVPKTSPLRQISLDELDRIYSADRRRAGGAGVANWGDLGVSGTLATEPVMAISAVDDSLEQIYFKQQVMMQGGFISGIQQASDTRALFETLAANPAAIGFGVLTTPPAGVRILPIAQSKDERAVVPSEGTARSGEYPLARSLSVYVVRAPYTDFEPATRDLLSFILSNAGQTVVRSQGLIPISAQAAKLELDKLQ